jgi:imidazolonepropionase-like amidohydrolase
MKRILAAAAAALAALSLAQAQDVTLVHVGTLVAVPGEAPARQQTVVIRDGMIEAVRPGYLAAEDAGASGAQVTVVDATGLTVLPGLIDGHVHLTSENNPRQRLETVEMSDADRALLAAKHAEATLMAGFTTVRDVGARSREAIFALREASAKGWVPAPRIYASGDTISVTGGHGDGTQGYRDDVAHVIHSTGVCDGPDACRAAVREQVRRGADHIKLTATGGVLSNTATGTGQQFTDEELAAIVDAAHAMGRKVTAHAHGKDGIDAALRAGVDSIEHGTYLDQETARLFRRSNAYLVPTVLAGVTVAEWAADEGSFLTPFQREKAATVGPQMLEMARRAHEAGVPIAFGTDTGVSRHGENAREFALLVEAGLTPTQAIRAATVEGARNMGLSEEIGTIEPGKRADLIGVDEDPLADVSALMDVDLVIKDGRVYKRP